MTPSDYCAGDSNSQICFALEECSFGSILVAASKIGVCTIALGNDPHTLIHDLQYPFPHAEFAANNKFGQWIAKVVYFIETPAIELVLPLDIRGTALQRKVWQALQKIPIGKRMSYTEIAQYIGKPKATRAVASACAANILAVAIPCHRAVRSNGNLSGYRWGVERKAELLRRESLS
ncbi:methylated-DNA--[protein]-cysteine S-methyltransferase [Nitrosomonas ureae]|uniref:methylated-DNA--[protein]-cysteine S-methyltransferase n=1 Tax=Nitrosomonas ureae TaxID=44577 RepID=A0A1H5WY84_9PROT|nr:methylated-DNA--[protein]-cysteine S-methyltransferase [Nitrosomonas ureae]SEG04408.1 AraC family transcriptional regulator, regulatory protein of adaptative response / methylated-DNA-[protein]-cysteine methyltransferase [Nitrosomonas ureae]